MKALELLVPKSVFVDIGQEALTVFDGDNAFAVALERTEAGRLTAPCKDKVTSDLQRLLSKQSWGQRRRAFCAIGTRGVSLRRLTLPNSSKEELQRLVALQIEAEFPLPPDELAWGYRDLGETNGTRELTVVAVKREIIEEYSELLAGCGLHPVFTLAALARDALCPPAQGTYGLLDLGRTHSELITFENGVPTAIRMLPWGGENLTRSIQTALEISPEQAEEVKTNLINAPPPSDERGLEIQKAIRAELDLLRGYINSNRIGGILYLTGETARLKSLRPGLNELLKNGVGCEVIEDASNGTPSATIRGLKKAFETTAASPPLLLQIKRAKGAETVARPEYWKWATAACLLALISVFLRYAEALFLKSRLTKQIAQARAYKDAMPALEKELGFLQYLQTNQPPYLDASLALANAAIPGTRIESLSMNRRGEVSLRGTMQNPQQAVDFRSKLIASGFFASVVLDEQTPSPDQQKVSIRLTAQWKPAGARPTVAAESSAPKQTKKTQAAEVAKTNVVGPSGTSPTVLTNSSAHREETKK